LKKEKEKYNKMLRQPRLLILGTSDSGKSTLLKQLKILHGGGFSDDEKERYRQAIASNIASATYALIQFMRQKANDLVEKVSIIYSRTIKD
jgi:ABC-type lipoprotein export system ATPase subunit